MSNVRRLSKEGSADEIRQCLFCLLLVTKAFGNPTGTISGTASYRERIALPPEAVFEATLEVVSKADTPAEVIGQVRIEAPDNPPIHFTISYDRGRIEASHTYVVRGRILSSGH